MFLMPRLGDTVVLKDLDYFEEYNGQEAIVLEIHMGVCYRVKCDGFDPIWVTAKNFEQGE